MRRSFLLLLMLAVAISTQPAATQGKGRIGQGKPPDQAHDQDQPDSDGQPPRHGRGRPRGPGQGVETPPAEGPEQAIPQKKGGRTPLDRANAAFQHHHFAQAERMYRQVLASLDQRGGGAAPLRATVLSRLGASLIDLGRYPEAEAFLRQGLSIGERLAGDEQPLVATLLGSLGSLMRLQGRLAEAEPLLRRALDLRERLQPDSVELATTLNQMALLLRAQRLPADAEAIIRRALAIREARLGPDHPAVAMTISNLAMAMRAQGKAQEANALMQRAVAIQESRLGPWSPRLATTLNTQGLVKLSAHDDAAAEGLFRRAGEIRDHSLGARHPETAQAYGNLALALARQQKFEEALAAIRRATEIARARREGDEQRHDEGAESERRSARWLFARHVGIAHGVFRHATTERKRELSTEAFEMAQWAQAGGVAGALARMAARFAAGSGPLAALVRDRQDLLGQRQSLDRSLLDEVSKSPQERDAEEEAATRAEIADLDKRLAALDQAIAKDYPSYAELASARPLSLVRLRELLQADEAMLVYLIRDDDAFVWAIRRGSVTWHRLPGNRASFDQAVQHLRATLNPAQNRGFEPFPLDQAQKLYQSLVAPAQSALAGAKHLIVVPDGPLQSLPFSLLVADPPQDGGGDPDYRAADWLVRKYALSVLPSVSSIQALRVMAAAHAKREPFAGFGDPALTGKAPPGTARGTLTAAFTRGHLNESQIIQQFEPLPESAKELAELALYMHAPAGRVWTGADATETKVKSTDLSKFRVLAFATHGLMAGEFLDFAEPSLVLTPPAVGTSEDDGLLTASEVAQLRLDADWVILSACNTAAPDASPGAEGLSGLAKSFFYAGARSLLVSNWYVASDAAVKLTTGAVAAMDQNPGLGRAEALRRSMLALLDDPATPKQATHPMFWAPFILVGEGGAGR